MHLRLKTRRRSLLLLPKDRLRNLLGSDEHVDYRHSGLTWFLSLVPQW